MTALIASRSARCWQGCLTFVWCVLVWGIGAAAAQTPTPQPTHLNAAARPAARSTKPGSDARPASRSPAGINRRVQRGQRTSRYFRAYRADDVYLATMGPGNWLFTYFGHNAVRVRSRRGYPDINYNFGTFGFPNNFTGGMTALYEYLQFTMKYWLGLHRYRSSVYWYRRQDRTYHIRPLYLTPQESNRLVAYLKHHALPENKYYKYHHYTNNCSTKVRDALARFIGPEFKKRAMVKRGRTYRSMVMEKMSPNPVVKVLMDFGMGPMADVQRTWWEEMFLPERLDDYVSQPFWEKLRGRPLVGPKTLLHRRRARPAWWTKIEAPTWIYFFLVLWAGLGLLFWNSRFFRTWLRVLLLMLGGLGAALTFMLVFTKFPEPPGNANLLFYHPLHWLVWWGLSQRRWSASPLWRTGIRWYFALHTGGATLYLLLKLMKLVPYQLNLHYILFILVTMGLATVQLWRNPNWGVVQEAEITDESTALHTYDAPTTT